MEATNEIPAMVYLWSLGTMFATGCAVWGGFLFWTRYFDRRTKINWRKDVWPDICNGNLAMGVYMGCRLLACALVALAISLALK